MNRWPYLAAAVASSLLVSTCAAQTSGGPEGTRAAVTPALDSAIAEFLDEEQVPGAVVAVLDSGGVAYARGHGVRSLERNEPMTIETMFQIGSFTKLFTNTLLRQLRDEGLISLDHTLDRYLPPGETTPAWIRGTDRVVPTVGQLALHLSGFPREPPNRRNRPNSPSVMEPYSIAELYAGLSETSLDFEPGTSWSYSNFGYAALGHILELVTGRRYEELLSDRLLVPLGMSDTRITLTPEDEARLAAHYWTNRPRRERERWMFGEVAAFGGLASTVEDLATFLGMHMMPDDAEQAWPISAASLVEMRTSLATWGDDGNLGFTHGWFATFDTPVGPVYHHGGEVDGHSTWISFAPDVGMGLIVLTNVGGDTAQRLHDAIADVAMR